jgi:hypothetical protein
MEREQGLMTPFVRIERMKPEPGDSAVVAAGKALFNVISGVEESFFSLGGVITGGTGAVPQIGRVTVGAFGLDMAAHIPEQISAGLQADTTQGKIEGWLGTLTSLAIAGLSAKYVIKGNAKATDATHDEAPPANPPKPSPPGAHEQTGKATENIYPGPLKIKPMKDLSPEQAEVEARLAFWIQEDLNRASRLYAEIAETEHGRLIDVDAARKLSLDYDFNKQSRTKHTLSVNSVAGTFVAKRLLPAALRKLQPEEVMGLTAGGPGSGKGTIKAIYPREWHNAKFVYDGVLRRYDRAKDLIEKARSLGATTTIWYVHAPVEQAVVQAMRRAETGGRVVPLKILAESHFDAQKTIVQLLEQYAGDPRVDIQVIDNSKPTPKIVEKPLDFLRNESVKYENAETTEIRARRAFRINWGELSNPEARSIFQGSDRPDGSGRMD